jgi:hypothetical protein
MYILLLTGVVLAIVIPTRGLLQPYLDANIDWQLQLQAAQGRAVSPEVRSAAQRIGSIGYVVSSILTPAISALVGGVMLLVGAKLMRIPLRYQQAMIISILAAVPRVLGMLALAIQAALLDGNSSRMLFTLSLGPLRFMDVQGMSPAILGVLATLDVFNVWLLALTAIGTWVVAKVDRSTGAVAAVVSWGIGAIATLVPSLFR